MRLRQAILTLGLGLTACRGGPEFGPAVTLVDRDAANPTVAVDGWTGTIYVAYARKGADSAWAVWLARVDSAGGIAAPIRASDGSEEVMIATENPPQVAVGGDGTVYVAWVSSLPAHGARPKDIHIRLIRSTDGGETFQAVASPGEALRHPTRANLYYDLATGPGGSLAVSYLDLRFYTDSLASRETHHVPDSIPVPESRVEFRVAHSSNRGESFAPSIMLDTAACICCRTAIVTGPDGEAHAMWRHVFPGDVRDFLSARSSDGAASFSTPSRVHDDHWVLNGCPDIGPDIAVDGKNTVHAAWYTGAPGRQGLWYAASVDGGRSFGAPVPVLTDRYVPPSEVKLATLGSSAWVIWEDRRRQPGGIVLARVGERRGTRIGNGEYPAIAAGAQLLAVAWTEKGAIRMRTAQLR